MILHLANFSDISDVLSRLFLIWDDNQDIFFNGKYLDEVLDYIYVYIIWYV
jgi:hypothetical protein